MDMKQFYLKSLFLSLLMIVVGSISANAEEETIATFTASDYKSGTTGGWNVSNANYATAGGGYYQLTYGNASIVSPSINFSNYSDITITISARKYGGPDATQSKISVSQGETELASYSPSGTSIAASSALAISPAGGTITVSCPGASGGKGCGVQSIVIKGTPKAVSKTLSSISLFGTYPTTFNVGDTFSHEGMTVTATYDDNTSEDVTEYATFDGYDMSAANTYEVTVSYTEREVTKTATYDITVNAVAVTGITLDQEAIQLKAGKTKQLTATVTPDNATDKTVAWSSSDESVATVSEDGTVTAVAEGTATITATANGGDNITATCVVTVPAPLVATGCYEKVTTAPSDWSGEYLIVYEEGSVAFNGGLSTLDAVGNTIEVVMNDNKIDATEETDAAAFTIAKNADGAYTIKSASGKYIGVSSNSNGLKQTDNASTYTHHLSIDDDENAVIKAAFSGSNMSLRYNYANNQTRFRYYSNGQQPIQLYKKVTTTTSQYTLVAGTEEYPFEGLTLTKELPAQTDFYIKDGTGKEYHSTDAQSKLTIIAENHENLPTSAEGNDFYLSKANTWVFTLTEGEGGAVTLTVNPETPGATQYMLSETYLTASDDIFDASYKLTKEMTTDEFFIVRSDDYGLTNLTPANFNAPEDRRYWIFSEDAPTVEFITGEIRGSYTVAEAGLYNITLDLTNNTVTAEATSTVIATGNLNNTDTGVFAGVTGFTTGTNSASGTLKTGVGDVTVDYAGTTNSYLNNTNIGTYANGTTLKFTAPEGYVLTGIDITFSRGVPGNLTTTPNDTYTSNTESNLGSWSGGTRGAKTVTFTGQNATSYLTTAEVTLMKASLSPKLDRIDVEGYTTDFVVGDTYIFDGTATVTYEDGSTKEVTSEVEVFGPDMSMAGDKSANISYTENGLSVVAVISINVREPQDITFRKISSTDELVAGKRYVIVDENHNVAMGACSNPSSTTSYFTKFEATFSDESVTLKEGKANANILTLGGEEGAWTFATSIEANKYLAYTGSGNYLESGANAAAASAQWTVTFDEDGNARILNTNEAGRYIRYNSSQPRFACYKSTENYPYGTQNAVQLYVESDLEDVTLTITAAGYATLYYSDRALKVPEDVTAKTYKVVDGKLAESKTYASGSKIPKGEAVVLKGAPGEYTFKVTSTAEPKDADNQLKGSDEAEETTGGNYYYALQAKSKDGKHGPGMYWMNSTGEAFNNGAHKAYMALGEKFAEAQGMAKEFYLFVEATTGISGIDAASADRTEMYNLNGQRVDRGYKGVVIKNGKKILVK